MNIEQIKKYSDKSQKINEILNIYNQVKLFFQNFEFNNEKNCVEVILDEESNWNTLIDTKKEITFYIVHKKLFTANILLLHDVYHWELPDIDFRFNKNHINQFKKDYPEWKNGKYFNFMTTIKKFIIEKWNLTDGNDLFFGFGYHILKKIFPNYKITIIPAFRFLNFDHYSLRHKKTYTEGIFYRLRTRDYYARFPKIEKKNMEEKNKITNNNFFQTIRLIKWLYYLMNWKNEQLEKEKKNFDIFKRKSGDKYYLDENVIFDYLLYNAYYKYFTIDDPLKRCIIVIEDILAKISMKYKKLGLPNELIGFFRLKYKPEKIKYALEQLLNYINEHYQYHYTDEFQNQLHQEVENFVDYMENFKPWQNKN